MQLLFLFRDIKNGLLYLIERVLYSSYFACIWVRRFGSDPVIALDIIPGIVVPSATDATVGTVRTVNQVLLREPGQFSSFNESVAFQGAALKGVI